MHIIFFTQWTLIDFITSVISLPSILSHFKKFESECKCNNHIDMLLCFCSGWVTGDAEILLRNFMEVWWCSICVARIFAVYCTVPCTGYIIVNLGCHLCAVVLRVLRSTDSVLNSFVHHCWICCCFSLRHSIVLTVFVSLLSLFWICCVLYSAADKSAL